MERLYLGMLNSRLEEISQKPDAPFLGAEASKGSFIGRSTDAFTLGSQREGRRDRSRPRGAARPKRSASTSSASCNPSSIARRKTCCAATSARTPSATSRSRRRSCRSTSATTCTARPFPGIEYEYKLAQQLVPTITLADVNKLASNWITDDNRIILAESPDKDGVKVPTRAELLAVFDRAAKTKVVAYTREPVDRRAGRRTRRRPESRQRPVDSAGRHHASGQLSNGVRVLVKPTDFKADEVLFSATSPGGTSLASERGLHVGRAGVADRRAERAREASTRSICGKKLSGQGRVARARRSARRARG